MAGENWTMWLNITNFALGIVTLVALVLVFVSVGWDLFVRKVGRTPVKADLASIESELRAMMGSSHSMHVPELGLTMADGGEKIDPSKHEPEK